MRPDCSSAEANRIAWLAGSTCADIDPGRDVMDVCEELSRISCRVKFGNGEVCPSCKGSEAADVCCRELSSLPRSELYEGVDGSEGGIVSEEDAGECSPSVSLSSLNSA